MRPVIRLSLKELDEMIKSVEAVGGDAEELKKQRALISNSKWLARVAGKPLGEEEHIEALRQRSVIEQGKDLECVVCHGKFGQLISGTCEACFRKWALATKRR